MALEVAVSTEQGALRYYTRLAEMTEDAELKALYREFVDFESGHTDALQKKMASARRTSGGTKLA
jgi:rubrerythrin